MSITVEWDNPERTIILCTYRDTWTWEEFFGAAQEASDLQDTVQHTVDMVLDMRDSASTPSGVTGKFKEIARISHPNTGIRVLVTDADVMKLLFQVFATVYRPAARKYQVVDSLEKAYALIANLQQQRATGVS